MRPCVFESNWLVRNAGALAEEWGHCAGVHHLDMRHVGRASETVLDHTSDLSMNGLDVDVYVM